MQNNKKISKCFMNGKSCIYERTIHETIENLDLKEKKSFVIMPFDRKLNALYQWEIAPFIGNGGKGRGEDEFRCIPERADDIRQVGFIICEKICKKIQEANYITAELSFDNPNVFYELGLSVALKKKILPLCLEDYEAARKTHLQKIGINKTMTYIKFDLLEKQISEYILNLNEYKDIDLSAGNKILILHFENINKNNTTNFDINKFEFSYGPLYKTAVGNAISKVFSDKNKEMKPDLKLYQKKEVDEISKIKEIDLLKSDFQVVKNSLKDTACILVDISENININYFWLGYLHGVGANVIPINRIKLDEKDKTQNLVPFDIRALWHIVFNEDNPIELSSSLIDILEFIFIEKAKDLNRRKFWYKILQSTEVSIFLGSLYLSELGRNTIGDWDYRTAAEITKYLSSSKETIKVTLESPLPKRKDRPDQKYVNWLKANLRDKNCIIVASADVNDLTEVALSEIYSLQPFKKIPTENLDFKGYIAYKEYSKDTTNFPETAFYRRNKTHQDKRGFIIKEGKEELSIAEEHLYPTDSQDATIKKLYGQLIVSKNPFSRDNDKWIIIISGISGPATFGIAQMLTGGVYQEFTINKMASDSDFTNYILDYLRENEIEKIKDNFAIQYEALSEEMIQKILDNCDEFEQTNALIDVGVFYPGKNKGSFSNDERKIVAWNFTDITGRIGRKWSNPNDIYNKK